MKRGAFAFFCNDLRFSSGSGLLTLNPVLVKDAKLSKTVIQSNASRSEKENIHSSINDTKIMISNVALMARAFKSVMMTKHAVIVLRHHHLCITYCVQRAHLKSSF